MDTPPGLLSRRRFLQAATGLGVLALGGGESLGAVPEHTAKALLVFHLISFVTWPAEAAGRAFRIGLLGARPLGGALEAVVAGEQVEGRPIEVRQRATAARLTDCQLVFVDDDSREPLRRSLAALGGRPILTVGEADAFLDAGGMVRLGLNGERKLRPQVNLDAVRSSALRISSQFLRVAEIVKGRVQ